MLNFIIRAKIVTVIGKHEDKDDDEGEYNIIYKVENISATSERLFDSLHN